MQDEQPIDEFLLKAIHDDYDEVFLEKLGKFLSESGASHGAVLQACCDIIAQAIFHEMSSEEQGCAIVQHYGIYTHRIFHSLWEHNAHKRQPSPRPNNVVPLKKKH